jgi:hypothetical protein
VAAAPLIALGASATAVGIELAPSPPDAVSVVADSMRL